MNLLRTSLVLSAMSLCLGACGATDVSPDGHSVVPPPDVAPSDAPPAMPDAAAVCHAPNGQVLMPGQSYSEPDATCVCSTSGTLNCVPNTTPGDGGPPPPMDGAVVCVLPNDGVLAVGQSIAIGCAIVTCEPNGTLAYDTRMCGDSLVPDSGTFCTLPNGEQIPPGQSSFDGCNTCFCNGDGSLTCTHNDCTDAGPSECTAPNGQPIFVGGTWTDGMLNCFCAPGAVLECSPANPMSCQLPDGEVIPVGGVGTVGCETCFCGAGGALSCSPIPGCGTDGGPAYCNSPQGILMVGQSFSNGCETCTCEPGGALACSGVGECDAGPPVDAGPPQFCYLPNGGIVPVGQPYFDGCNMCFCLPGGVLQCTSNVCDAGPPVDAGPPPPVCFLPNGGVLLVGQSYFDGCNTCVCLPGGALSCTTNACDAGPPVDAGPQPCYLPDGQLLPPGQSSFDGCNNCYCDPTYGLECTGNVCDAGNPTDASVSCNALSLAGIGPPAIGFSSSTTTPTGTGGMVANGTYVLTSVTFYGEQPPNPFGPWLMQIDDASVSIAASYIGESGTQNANFFLTLSGDQFSLTETCPAPTPPSTVEYSVSGENLTLIVQNSEVLVFTLLLDVR